MAADSLAARRAVREHLEANFEEYLSNVSSYLRQAYPELQLSAEMSEEIAATVIVRVSHSNPEPTDLEKALCKSADDVVRSRRPRLSQARLLEEMNGPLRSEFPRALPSLRLIQSFSRGPAAGQDGETSGAAGFAQGTRLVLANPPVDLGASIGFGGALTAEREPSFGPARSAGESLAPTATSEPARLQAPGHPAKSAELASDDEDAGFESGTLQEVHTLEDSRVDVKRSNLDDDFFGEDSPLAVESAPLARALRHESDADDDGAAEDHGTAEATGAAATHNNAGMTSGDEDEQAADSEREWGALRSEPARAAAAEPSPQLDVDADFDEAVTPSEATAESAHVVVTESAAFNEPQAGGALFGTEKFSSIPPTKESLLPGPAIAANEPLVPASVVSEPQATEPFADEAATRLPVDVPSSEADVGAEAVDGGAAPEPRPRTRRKVVRRGKKSSPKKTSRSASSKSTTKATPKRRTTPKRVASPARSKEPALGAPRGPNTQFVPDDLAVIAMLGFPDNPKRAAKLCVMAMCEELGLDGLIDVGPLVLLVTSALDELRVAFESAPKLPADAHLRWQRTARQATLRACMTSAK